MICCFSFLCSLFALFYWVSACDLVFQENRKNIDDKVTNEIKTSPRCCDVSFLCRSSGKRFRGKNRISRRKVRTRSNVEFSNPRSPTFVERRQIFYVRRFSNRVTNLNKEFSFVEREKHVRLDSFYLFADRTLSRSVGIRAVQLFSNSFANFQRVFIPFIDHWKQNANRSLKTTRQNEPFIVRSRISSSALLLVLFVDEQRFSTMKNPFFSLRSNKTRRKKSETFFDRRIELEKFVENAERKKILENENLSIFLRRRTLFLSTKLVWFSSERFRIDSATIFPSSSKLWKCCAKVRRILDECSNNFATKNERWP